LDKKYPFRYVIPLAYRDIYEAFLDQDVPQATALSMLTFFGMGLQTYEQKGKQTETLYKRAK
jgi:hypothetical protein